MTDIHQLAQALHDSSEDRIAAALDVFIHQKTCDPVYEPDRLSCFLPEEIISYIEDNPEKFDSYIEARAQRRIDAKEDAKTEMKYR